VRRVHELLASSEKREALGRALAGLLKEGARERMISIVASL